MKKLFISILIIASFCQVVYGQTDKKRAYELGMQAINLMDKGEIEKSIELLEEAKKLDPDNVNYPYEIAYAFYLDKNYKKSIKLLESLKKHKNANDRVHQLLGNSYSLDGQSDKAIAAYEHGLSKFPNSGILHLERGNMEFFEKDYEKALFYYEKGIKVEPQFPSNYYWASKIYCNSTEEVWGMIYGEIFMNLERNTKRTAEISKLLYDTYKSQIQITNDTSFTVSFSKFASVVLNNGSDFKLPFGVGVYEPTIMMSIIGEKKIDVASLSRIRKNFIDIYFKNKSDKQYPNILFDYHKKIIENGHFEAYTFWILMKGDENQFNDWYNNNKQKYNDFVAWFTDHALDINDQNKFHRQQY